MVHVNFLCNFGGSTFAHIFERIGSFAHTISPGKRFHLRTQFYQVNVTFAHIKFSPVNGMFALAGLYRQAKWNILKQILENEEFYMKVLDSEKKKKVRRYTCGDA